MFYLFQIIFTSEGFHHLEPDHIQWTLENMFPPQKVGQDLCVRRFVVMWARHDVLLRCLCILIYIYHLVCILINIWTADWAKQLSEAIVPSLALRSHPESNMNFTSESYKRKFPFFQRVPCLSGVFVISAYGYQEFMFPTSWTSFVSGSDSRRPEGMMWTCHSLTRLDTRENCPDMIFRWGRSLIEDPFPATC